MIKSILKLMLILSITGCQTLVADVPAEMTKILAGEHRKAEHKIRDSSRHPQQTLAFFGVNESMKVVEIWPGGGWYTEILAPLLRNKGKLYAAHFGANSGVTYFTKSLAKFSNKLENNPQIYNKVEVTVLQPPKYIEIAPAGSVDRVLTFRNVHNWMKAGTADAVFSAMFTALKPGGILGLVEHRGDPAITQDERAKSGYVNQAYVITLAKKAGFELAGQSEINANPADNRQHPKGVWTLPPSLRLKMVDRERYLAIGESDRMTLKFIKPL